MAHFDGTLNPPKRKNSRRTVKLTRSAAKALKHHRARQNEQRLKARPGLVGWTQSSYSPTAPVRLRTEAASTTGSMPHSNVRGYFKLLENCPEGSVCSQQAIKNATEGPW